MTASTDILCIERKFKDRPAKDNMGSFIANFARGCGGRITSWEESKFESNDFVLWGAGMIKAVKHAEAQGNNYYYIDNGYFGNYPSKKYFRIIRNATHDTRPIIDRPDDRLLATGVRAKPFKRGSRIIVAPPSPKSFTLWDIDQPTWIKNTVEELKKHTDRPISIREKRSRKDRLHNDTIQEDLANDCHCLVTYNSVAAVEALIEGRPVITLGPNAATHPASHALSEVEHIRIPTDQERERWMRHLAYSQFTHQEMINGTAWEILNGQ